LLMFLHLRRCWNLFLFFFRCSWAFPGLWRYELVQNIDYTDTTCPFNREHEWWWSTTGV
jgi:hypothetical protein